MVYAKRTMKALTLLVLLSASAAFAQKAPPKLDISMRVFRTQSSVDTMKVKAIGSRQTKTSPTILMVTPAEAARIEKLYTTAADLAGAPRLLTMSGQQAEIFAGEKDGSYVSFQVLPTNRNNDITTLQMSLKLVTIVGTHRITRSATMTAKVIENRRLLIIEDPRSGEPGLLAILSCRRVK